jgi:hypothetical protein
MLSVPANENPKRYLLGNIGRITHDVGYVTGYGMNQPKVAGFGRRHLELSAGR